jgi:hypothetical protein
LTCRQVGYLWTRNETPHQVVPTGGPIGQGVIEKRAYYLQKSRFRGHGQLHCGRCGKKIAVGSDAAKLDFKTDPELAAGKYRISLKSKLPHLASILDGHFVAGYRIWDRLGYIEYRWF